MNMACQVIGSRLAQLESQKKGDSDGEADALSEPSSIPAADEPVPPTDGVDGVALDCQYQDTSGRW